ncbi:alpha/beta fold hydrolase [uncultured Phenylobacterium sp.]|uniref:alpha/beta hydrolase family protein n=1 Tax=uncultured Phenylobacterium sp. TaxID=349273 RepID=UPI0025D72209|nr:alpha/beta fold hydrolase [uncultured Phenylobacterium sp.]
MAIFLKRWVPALSMATLLTGGLMASGAKAQDAVGEWNGLLNVGAAELRIGVTIEAGPGGALTGKLASPDQGAMQIPLQDIRMDQGRLTFAVPSIRGRYEGQWDASQGVWNGSWTQGGALPLTLAKGPAPTRARPQVPAKPYPYREEEVRISSARGVSLAGTLTLPLGKGPFPAAVLISGSGPQDRDEQLLGHRPFLVLADHLTRQGIAVLRYDDRGFGRSTGRFSEATSSDFAVDAGAAVAFLRARKDIVAANVGLIGHSEGGAIGPMVAAKDPRIGFVVLLAGPGVRSRDLMMAQRRAVGRVMGLAGPGVERNDRAVACIDAVLAETPDWEAAKVEAARLLGEAAAEAGVAPETLMARSTMLFTPWYREFIAYDPRPNLETLRMPVLAVNGANDVQVVASQNLPAVREALRANPDVTVIELPGLNHLFQTSATGDPREYGRIEETFAPAALKVIGDWVVAKTGAGPR